MRSKGITEPESIPSQPLLYLIYHQLSATPDSYGYSISTSEFENHLRLVQKISALADGWVHPRITFDDGHASHSTYALPLLEQADIKAHFFITAGWISNRNDSMTWNDVVALHKCGHHIGAHGLTHKLLTHCSSDELDAELTSSKSLLEDKLGVAVQTMSLPGGRYNDAVLAACKRAGYTSVFTSVPRVEHQDNPQLSGRLNVRSGADERWLESLLRPRSPVLKRIIYTAKAKAIVQRTIGDGAYYKLWSLLNHANTDDRID